MKQLVCDCGNTSETLGFDMVDNLRAYRRLDLSGDAPIAEEVEYGEGNYTETLCRNCLRETPLPDWLATLDIDYL